MLYAMLLGLNRPMGPPDAPAWPDAAEATAAEEEGEATGRVVKQQQREEEEEEEEEDKEEAGPTLRLLLRVAGLVLVGGVKECWRR